ncbi:hypothetical protein ATANTOWER_014588 [Ataeniobius toweri]|uniref:Uncharacterized protein n=1 Tax=Ataeniobius toweri TaxID=208326 RepID=A0ABU7CGK7_9TELE|nr:hypothetical protein [Ataeniobius toweri]
MNAGYSNSKSLLNFVACDQCDCRNFVIFGPVLYFNFIPLESLRALGLGWGRRSCQQRVGSLMSQLQPQFICTFDILICIHHNTPHYHRHTHQHHGEGAVLGGHRMLPWFRYGAFASSLETGGVWMALGSLMSAWGAQQGAAHLSGVLLLWVLRPCPRVVGSGLVAYCFRRCLGLAEGCRGFVR